MSSCSSDPDYPNLGMQSGEEVATTLRLVALCISISVLFPWLDPRRRSHMRIFFLHWASGVMYVLSQFIMSVMVLNCWSSKDTAGPVIYILKFWELTVLNLWSISSLAIAVLIASIVQSFVKFRRVPSMIGSSRTAIFCCSTAMVATILSAAFWNGIKVTGGYFWVTNTNTFSHARWISLSFGATQTVAGVLMAVAVTYTLTGARRASLRVCCNTSQRVYFHFILTIFGTCVYMYNGIVLMFDEFSDFRVSKRLVIIGWCSRYVHVIADTAIIFTAFNAMEKKERAEYQAHLAGGSGRGSGSGSTSGTGPSNGCTTAPTFTPLPRPLVVGKSKLSRENSRTCSRAFKMSNTSDTTASTSTNTISSSTPASRNGKGNGSDLDGAVKAQDTNSRSSVAGPSAGAAGALGSLMSKGKDHTSVGNGYVLKDTSHAKRPTEKDSASGRDARRGKPKLTPIAKE